jgi:uncharacterized membrane protein YqjE
MDTPQPAAPDGIPGLLTGLGGLARNMLGLALSRVELAGLELSEVRANFLKLALVFALGVILVWFAVAYWTALIVVLAWDTMGWKILAIIGAVFTGLAAWVFSYARAMVNDGKLSMPATMSELRNDRDALL